MQKFMLLLVAVSLSLMETPSVPHAAEIVRCEPSATPGPGRAQATSTTAAARRDADLARARTLRLRGNLPEAAAAVDRLATQYPNDFGILYNKGLVLSDQKQFQQAETVLNNAVKVLVSCPPQSAKPDYSVYNTLGWVQMVQGKSSDAEKNFKTALAHEGQLTTTSVGRTKSNLGYLYFSAGDFEKAQPLLEDAAKNGNENAGNTLDLLKRAESLYLRQKQQNQLQK